MFEASLPVGVGVHQVELVSPFEMLVGVLLDQATSVDGRSGDDQVGTGLIQSHRVERGQNTQVGHDGGIVVIPAVTFGRHVHDETDVEIGLVFQYGLGIFGNLVVQSFRGVALAHDGGIVLAQGYTLPATYTFVIIDDRFVVGIEVNGIVGAMFHADVAALAILCFDFGLRVAVQFQFTAYAGATHTQVFQCAAESGLLVSLEVSHRDNDVGIGQSRANFGSLAILSVQRYLAVFSTFQAVGNDYLALGRDGIVAILHGALQVIHGIGAATRVEGITVGEEGFGSPRAEQIGESGRIVGAQVGQVTRFAEVYLDGNELVFEIDGLDSGPFD